jgi:hypothetical protein
MKEDVEWDKSRNAEWLILLENLSINNKINKSESYDEKTGEVIMTKLTSNDKRLTVFFEGNLKNKKTNIGFIPQSTRKTLDFLRFNSNLVNSNRLQGNMSEYMHYRNWINKKKAYRQIKKDLEFLSRIRLEYNNDKNHFEMMSLWGGDYGIKHGNFFFLLSQPFASVYREMITQYVNPTILGIDTNKHPPAYVIAKKLFEIYSMNRNKSNIGIIAIGNLIKDNPYIPKYNPKSGNIHRNIINPTIRSLKALSIMFAFHNINELYKQNDILTFSKFNLRYTPIHYPVLETANA